MGWCPSRNSTSLTVILVDSTLSSVPLVLGIIRGVTIVLDISGVTIVLGISGVVKDVVVSNEALVIDSKNTKIQDNPYYSHSIQHLNNHAFYCC